MQLVFNKGDVVNIKDNTKSSDKPIAKVENEHGEIIECTLEFVEVQTSENEYELKPLLTPINN